VRPPPPRAPLPRTLGGRYPRASVRRKSLILLLKNAAAATDAVLLLRTLRVRPSNRWKNDAPPGGGVKVSSSQSRNRRPPRTQRVAIFPDFFPGTTLRPREAMKYAPTTMPPNDAQFLGSRGFQIAKIARIYRDAAAEPARRGRTPSLMPPTTCSPPRSPRAGRPAGERARWLWQGAHPDRRSGNPRRHDRQDPQRLRHPGLLWRDIGSAQPLNHSDLARGPLSGSSPHFLYPNDPALWRAPRPRANAARK
jgi:hypothetical protein